MSSECKYCKGIGKNLETLWRHLIHYDSPPVACNCPIHGESYVCTLNEKNKLGGPLMTCEKCVMEMAGVKGIKRKKKIIKAR